MILAVTLKDSDELPVYLCLGTAAAILEDVVNSEDPLEAVSQYATQGSYLRVQDLDALPDDRELLVVQVG